MNLDNLSEFDKRIIGEALRAAAGGPFFPDWEFHSLFGLDRSEVRAISDAWPNLQSRSADVALAVNNSLANLVGYPHEQDAARPQWVSVSPGQLNDILIRFGKT